MHCRVARRHPETSSPYFVDFKMPPVRCPDLVTAFQEKAKHPSLHRLLSRAAGASASQEVEGEPVRTSGGGTHDAKGFSRCGPGKAVVPAEWGLLSRAQVSPAGRLQSAGPLPAGLGLGLPHKCSILASEPNGLRHLVATDGSAGAGATPLEPAGWRPSQGPAPDTIPVPGPADRARLPLGRVAGSPSSAVLPLPPGVGTGSGPLDVGSASLLCDPGEFLHLSEPHCPYFAGWQPGPPSSRPSLAPQRAEAASSPTWPSDLIVGQKVGVIRLPTWSVRGWGWGLWKEARGRTWWEGGVFLGPRGAE